jgi:hypothetical protein
LLPDGARAIIRNEEIVQKFQAPETKTEMLELMGEANKALNQVLARRDFYREADFANVRIAEEAQALLKRRNDLSDIEVQILNRFLFESAFAGDIPKSMIQPATVHVKMIRTDKPIILALTAYESVRWVVEVAPGAKLTKVILGGSHDQEITGVNVSVTHTYRCGPTDPRARSDLLMYECRSKEDPRYVKLAVKLRAMTGLDIKSFQGKAVYDGKPFIVGAEN